MTDVLPAIGTRPAVNVLWTGGWDSTFRLLQLVLRHRVPVVPYYLEDATRASTGTELRTMALIAEHLRAAYPHTRELLHDVRTTAVADIAIAPDLVSALQEIRKRTYIGSQYLWLPAFSRHNQIHDLELGVHVDDKVQALVEPFAVECEYAGGLRSMRVDPHYSDRPEYVLFGDFRFPLFYLDKLEMERQAAMAGWAEIMEMTWFCHTPWHGKPCGLCPPCIYTIEEGLARRVPRSRRVLSFFYRYLVLPFKKSLRTLRT